MRPKAQDPECSDSGVHLDEPTSPVPHSQSTQRPYRRTKPLMMTADEKSSDVFSEEEISHTGGRCSHPEHSSKDSSKLTSFLKDFKDKCKLKTVPKAKTYAMGSGSVDHVVDRPRRRMSDEDEAVEVSYASGDDASDIQEIPIECASVDYDGDKIVFRCESSHEDSGSDDTCLEPSKKEEDSSDTVKPRKKRRFPKLMSLPGNIHRSHSAAAAIEIPEHSLFLTGGTDFAPDSMESRAAAYEVSYKALLRDRSTPSVRKTTSADAAMMAAEEKSKPKNIARGVKKKLNFLRRRNTDSVLTSGDGGGKIWKDGHPTHSDIVKWSKTFDNLLSDRRGVELFRGFLRSEFSDENIEFWQSCEQYKHCRSDLMAMLAEQIYSDFVAIKSPREVNLDSKTRLDIIANINHPTRETFTNAQKRVQALMEKDSYQRFLMSHVYQELLATHTKS